MRSCSATQQRRRSSASCEEPLPERHGASAPSIRYGNVSSPQLNEVAAVDAEARKLVDRLRRDVERIEETLDRLAALGAFDVASATGVDELHWRKQALELRGRLSVLV